MRIPQMVEIALSVYYILKRTDVEFTSSTAVCRLLKQHKPGTINTILHRLCKKGLLVSKGGAFGGYAVPSPPPRVSQIFEAISPDFWGGELSFHRYVADAQKKFNDKMKTLSIW